MKQIILAAPVIVLTGCAVGPNYTPPPQTAAPAAWSEELSGPVAPGPADVREWWKLLGDPALNTLIDRAIQGNRDLRVAQARVREARAQRGVAAGPWYPQLDASGSYTRTRRSQNTPQGRFIPTPESDLYQVGFDASWEIDIFGRVRRSVEAADADIEAAVEGRRGTLVTLLAEVARTYVDAREFQQRLAIAQQNLRSQADSLGITQARLEAGLTSELDVARARSQLESTRAQIPALEAGLRVSIHALSVLLGGEPGLLKDELLSMAAAVPSPPDVVPVGLPSDLLRRRADVRRAERDLAAATARIGVATADLFPRFSLTGSFGFQSAQIGDLPEGDSRFWSIGPAVRWPIFAGGRLRANVEVQNARQERALAAYEQTVLIALRDTEDALASYSRELVRRESLRNAVQANRRAVEIATELYSKGLGDFLSVLDAQRQLYALEDQLAVSDGTVTSQLIALYKALGGGWESFEPADAREGGAAVVDTPEARPGSAGNG